MNNRDRLCIKLIHCGSRNIANPGDQEEKKVFFIPMGVFALAGVLQKNNVDVEVIHLDLEPSRDIREVLDLQAVHAVGFDCHWVNASLVVLETAALIKSLNPRIFIFLGGYTASLFAGEIISAYPQVDAVIRGDGEIPLQELCRVLQQELLSKKIPLRDNPAEPLQKVQNLAWKGYKNKIQVKEISYVGTKAHMEALDFAAVDLLRRWEVYRAAALYYTHFQPINRTPMFLLEVGRGCGYACTFCGGNSRAQQVMNNRQQPLFRSVESVIGTIKKALAFGFQTFYTSMVSAGSDEWYTCLMEQLAKENLNINYVYGCERLPSKDLVDALSAASSQVVIELSPETADERIRKMNKDPRISYTNRQMEECLDYISKKSNVKVELFFGYYLAFDTAEAICGTMRYIIRLLLRYHGLVEVQYTNFLTAPGSLFFFDPGKYDLEMKVRNFSDYIESIKENYVIKKGQPADLLEYRPRGISPARDIEIRKQVGLFNHLFAVNRKSLTYLLQKTGDPGMVVDFLKPGTALIDTGNCISAERLKRHLLDYCKREKVLDRYLAGIIRGEAREQGANVPVSTSGTHLYLDCENVENRESGKNDNKKLLFARDIMEEVDRFDF